MASLVDMSGTYVLNKTISDSSDATLKMQGVGWIMRSAISISTVTMTIKQYTDEQGVVHVDTTQVASPSGTTNVEERPLNWEWREKNDKIWGHVSGRAKPIKLSELDDDWFKQGWTEECANDVVMYNEVKSLKDTWTALQVWGIAEIDGVKRHARRIISKKGDVEYRIVMYYDPKE